mgnify:CR=1 FL=1|jgi:hypothetical protein
MSNEYEKRIELFRKFFLFTREDIVKSINLLIEHTESNDEDFDVSRITQERRIALLKRFADVVSKSHLPILTDLWWFYDYSFAGGHLTLYMAEASEIEFIDDELDSMTSSKEETLIKVECDYLSVEKFAELHGVKIATAQQWIDRGKLKNARFVNNEWLIPETEDRPHKRIGGMQYYFGDESGIQSYEFPLLSSAQSVFINKDKEEKNMYTCSFYNFTKKTFHDVKLNKVDSERLEYIIISSGKATIDEEARFVPVIRE